MAGAPLLACERYDAVRRHLALDDISFDLRHGQILGLIGPNGAGKTTLFNCLTRLYTPSSGDILSRAARSSAPAAPHGPPRIGRTFQNVALFPHLTVIQNVLVGAHARSPGNFVRDALAPPGTCQRAGPRHHDGGTLGQGRRACRLVRSRRRRGPRRLGPAVRDAEAGGAGARARRGRSSCSSTNPPADSTTRRSAGSGAHPPDPRRARRHRAPRRAPHGLVMSVSDTVVVLNFGRKIAEGRRRGCRTSRR